MAKKLRHIRSFILDNRDVFACSASTLVVCGAVAVGMGTDVDARRGTSDYSSSAALFSSSVTRYSKKSVNDGQMSGLYLNPSPAQRLNISSHNHTISPAIV